MSERLRRPPVLWLAWRNARRHTRRTILTGSAVAVAVMALILGLSLADGILDGILDSYARLETGHIRIRGAGYTAREAFLPVHYNVARLDERLSVVRQTEGVKAVLPRIRASVLVDGIDDNRGAMLLGVDIGAEAGYLDPTAITSAGKTPRMGQAEALVGSGLAAKLGVGVGDSLVLLGQTAYRSLGGIRLAVSGLATSGIPVWDDRMVIVPIDQAQRLLDLPEAATEITVLVSDPDDAEGMKARLRARLASQDELELRTWLEQGPLVMTLQSARGGYAMVLMLLLFMAGLVVVNTILMTVMERTREHGVEAAMGMRGSDLVRLIVAEGVVIGGLGAAVGGAIGTTIALVLSHTGIDIAQAARTVAIPLRGMMYPTWAWWQTALGLLLGLVTAGIAALYPAWKTRRLRPAEAIRL